MATKFSSGSAYSAGDGISISSGGGVDYANMGDVDPYEAELAMQAAAGGAGSQLGRGFDDNAGSDSPSLEKLQQVTAYNTAIRNALGAGSVPPAVRDLNVRTGIMGTGGNSMKNYLSAGLSFLGLPNLPAIGQFASMNLLEGVSKGYEPQYNAIGQIVGTFNPETGQYGAGTVRSRIDPNNPQNTILDTPTEQGDDNPPMIMGGGGGSTAPEVAPEVSMIAPELRYSAGGIYPEEGMYRRTSLLDEAPRVYGGLLAGYDQPQFAEMNVGFRRPADVGLFQDPYDVTGYSLI